MPRTQSRVLRRNALTGLLAIVFVVLLATMPRWIYVGDAVAMRTATICWLNAGDMAVPADRARGFGERGQFFCENPATGKWYSKYGILNSLLYTPPLLMEKQLTGNLRYFDQLDDVSLRRRCVILNAYNILIALLLGTYLFHLALIYSPQPWHAAVYVLIAFFATFLWNYLRAQTIEIFQVLFFTAAYFHLVTAHRHECSNSRQAVWHVLLAFVFAGVLCLQKPVYVLLLPIVTGFSIVAGQGWWRSAPVGARDDEQRKRHWRSLGGVVVLSWIATCMLLLAGNWYCFGSPLSTGYGQWEQERQIVTSNLWAGLIGFLADPQKSIFVYFPLLLFAIPALVSFARRYRFDTALAGTTFVVFYLANSAFVNWRGDWCYGPRYLLFILPALSLPCLEILRYRWQFPWRRALAAVTASSVLLASAGLQLKVNAFEFFLPFRAQQIFREIDDPRIDSYFAQPHWVVIGDVQSCRAKRRDFPPLTLASQLDTDEQNRKRRESLHRIALPNLFWPLLKGSAASSQ